MRRIRRQAEAVGRLLADEDECAEALQLVAGRRGALYGLMAEFIEGQFRPQVLSSNGRFSSGHRATPGVNPVGSRAFHAAQIWHTGGVKTGV